jgi:phospholipid N-methyltransferase
MFSLGRDLVGFVTQPKHLSFFMASPTLAQAMKNEITKTHKISGHNPFLTPAPASGGLVKRILRARVRENVQTDKGHSS